MPFVLRRHASRVILLGCDSSGTATHVFLIQAVDPADASKPPWWEIPGGGIDPGESSADAAMRELQEEAGQASAEVGPIVFTQYVEFSFGGYDFEQDEVIHIAWTKDMSINRPTGLEYLEALAFRDARWWPIADVVASTEAFLPPRLPELIPLIANRELPDPPLDITPDADGAGDD